MEKYALITGASGGIGKAIARRLAADGYSLYLHYNNNETEIIELQKELVNDSTYVYLVKSDLSDPIGVSVLLKQIHNKIDTIIYSSGTSYYGLVTETNEETVDKLTQLHLKSPFTLIKSLLPNLVSNKNGSIVMISSIWGLTGGSCEVLYSMVKGGQIAYVKALAKEVALSNIRVNAIAPGAINTPMLLNDFTEEELSHLSEQIPMGRPGEAEEVAEAVAFLVSSKSSYITGQVLSVNGGWYC
ncbi:SDR family oxidoreductase [Bacillus luteolus]|uniref:SDR family oxidoreductase n=1 Tax=Litchfieldia luteola TaxID=682179 RepID=A0ABR9QJH9_9BACI|nr:SDR family oxidoreductase [Cytobacillus luteolus]MBE4908663.1 SDR family oxidoreductase [Cytobacillus luteolus]MBP1941520.1 3-oxoacyl-[acyl-carrier protein] reductase [Cytobacillus luteolus]